MAVVAAFALLRLVVRSPFGRALVGIRESESRMRSLGYHVWLHKYLAFLIAGGVGGVAGVFWAYYNGFVSPADLELATSVEVLLMVALGGPRHPRGAGARRGRRSSRSRTSCRCGRTAGS